MKSKDILDFWSAKDCQHVVFSEEMKDIFAVKAQGPHSHPFWELKFFDSYIMITPPNIIHAQIAMEDKSIKMVVWIDKSSIQFDRRKNFSFGTVEDFTGICALPPQILLEKIYSNRGRKLYKNLLEANLKLLLSTLALLPKKDSRTGKMSIVEQIKSYVSRYYYRQELCVSGMAQMFNITPGHLANIMKKSGNKPLSIMIIQLRLDNAMQLLATGRYSVKEVAAATGWNNEFYFSNVFKKHFGKRPSQVQLKEPAKYAVNP